MEGRFTVDKEHTSLKEPLLSEDEIARALLEDFSAAGSPVDQVAAARVRRKLDQEFERLKTKRRNKKPLLWAGLLAAGIAVAVLPRLTGLWEGDGERTKGSESPEDVNDMISLLFYTQKPQGSPAPLGTRTLPQLVGETITMIITAKSDQYVAVLVSVNDDAYSQKGALTLVGENQSLPIASSDGIYGYVVEPGDRSLSACALSASNPQKLQEIVSKALTNPGSLEHPVCLHIR